MHESVLISGLISNKDELLIAIPFGVLLVVQFFRLDALVAASRRPKHEARRFCGPDAAGDPILSDPDGHAVRSHRAARRQGLQSPAFGSMVESRAENRGDRSR